MGVDLRARVAGGLVLLVLMAALNVLLQDSLGRFGALMAAPTVLLLMAAAAMLVIGPVLALTFSVIAYLRDEPSPSDSPWARRRRQLMPVLVSLPLLLPIGLYAVLAVLTLFGVFGES